MRKVIISQFIVLLLGAIFAWGNLIIETRGYLNDQACSTGCTAGAVVNPIYTPCFYGACFFLVAFILSSVLLVKSKN